MCADIKISEAVAEDSNEIFLVQMAGFTQEAERCGNPDIEPLKQTVETIVREFDDHTFFKAVVDGRIVGTIRARIDNGECTVGRLAVLPEYQNRGIGRKLIRAAEANFPHAVRFKLFTDSGAEKNLYLYRSEGYRETGDFTLDKSCGIRLVNLVKEKTDK